MCLCDIIGQNVFLRDPNEISRSFVALNVSLVLRRKVILGFQR